MAGAVDAVEGLGAGEGDEEGEGGGEGESGEGGGGWGLLEVGRRHCAGLRWSLLDCESLSRVGEGVREGGRSKVSCGGGAEVASAITDIRTGRAVQMKNGEIRSP